MPGVAECLKCRKVHKLKVFDSIYLRSSVLHSCKLYGIQTYVLFSPCFLLSTSATHTHIDPIPGTVRYTEGNRLQVELGPYKRAMADEERSLSKTSNVFTPTLFLARPLLLPSPGESLLDPLLPDMSCADEGSSSSVRVWQSLVNSSHLAEDDVKEFYVSWARTVRTPAVYAWIFLSRCSASRQLARSCFVQSGSCIGAKSWSNLLKFRGQCPLYFSILKTS